MDIPVAVATPQRRDASGEREVDEYRIGPVAVSVQGPLSLRFPGAQYCEISVPSLAADVLVIASLADAFADGGSSLGIPRRFVKDVHCDRETGVVTFAVEGVKSFVDSVVTIRGRTGVAASFSTVPDGTTESPFGVATQIPLSPVRGSAAASAAGGITSPVSRAPVIDVSSQIMWLVTGHSGHASPAHDLVAKAATALHAAASLTLEHRAKHEAAQLAAERNTRRASRRKNLQERWAAAEESERQTLQTRALHDNGLASPVATAAGRRSISEIVASASQPLDTNDARAQYSEMMQGLLMRSVLARSPGRGF